MCDRALPGLSPAVIGSASAESCISIEFDPSAAAAPKAQFFPWYSTDILDERGEPALTIWRDQNSGDYSIRYTHGLTFDLNSALTRISIRCVQPISDDDVISFLLGPILGVLLRLRGVICLHASAVALGGRAVAIAGEEGAGKSTTAAAFARDGAPVLSDDIVALRIQGEEEGFHALPGYSHLNLWPDAAEMVNAPRSVLSSFSPECDKLRLHLDGAYGRFQREPLPLAAICILTPRSELSRAPFMVQLAPQAALMQLVARTYGNRLLDPRRRADEFAVLGRLVTSIPVWQVTAHTSPERLPELTRQIRANCSPGVKSHSAMG